MIFETIITTINMDGSTHIAPMGIRQISESIVVSPFKPSTTLENLRRNHLAVVNLTDDVRIFAGCLTGRYEWPTIPASVIDCKRLENTLAHLELKVEKIEEDELRPRFFCEVINQEIHKPFKGFNRAQAAVLEAAILVSRLHILSPEKIDAEIKYLEIAIEKTAGMAEKEAWSWLMDKITEFRKQQAASENII